MSTSGPVTGPVRVGSLVEEQAALRRVATLVAGGASSREVFEAVAQEVAEVLRLPNTAVCRYDDRGAVMTVLAVHGEHPESFEPGSRWPLDGPSMSAEVLRTGRPARVEDYTELSGSLAEEAREHGFDRVAGAPILVDGRVWGVISTSSPDAPLPDRLEERLAGFTELVATAIANSQAHEELTRLAEEQAALRRVATLVAQGASPAEVFAAVCAEVGQLVPAEAAALTRFEADGTVTALGGWTSSGGYVHVGTRYALEGTVSGRVFETRRPARIENYAEEPGVAAADARQMGWHSSVGAPITVKGRLWGALAVVSTSDTPLPRDAERRLAQFTELVATAIANAESGEELTRLAEEQAALRRVATLVALGTTPAELFEAMIAEVGRLIPADAAGLTRYESDGTVTIIGSWSRVDGYVAVGARHPLGPGTLGKLVFETCRPGRIDSYEGASGSLASLVRDEMGWRSAVGAPIVVEGRVWGVLSVGSTTHTLLPPDTEAHLEEFTGLVATAIANAESREELASLADEQAALRRVATLVAEGARPDDVFAAVSDEVARLLGVPIAVLLRYDPDGIASTILASAGAEFGPIGTRWPIERPSLAAAVLETGRSARIDDFSHGHGAAREAARASGVRWAVGVPVIVDGSLWGVMTAGSREPEQSTGQTESRLDKFTELLATAIANAESSAELDASRARIVATADATRRRIERDLHDGAQQHLVSLALQLRAAQAAVPLELGELREELSRVAEGHASVLEELREIAQGIHPATLAEGGLAPALKTLARRSPVPVVLEVRADGRLPERVEVAAYYVVSEALTNVAKYAYASLVHVAVAVRDGTLRVAVEDDGLGGADPALGSGLLGLKDRAEAIGGALSLESPPGAGTSLLVELPVDALKR